MAVGVGFIVGNKTIGRVFRKYGTANWIRPGRGDRFCGEDEGGRVWLVIVTGIGFVAFGILIMGLAF